MTPKELKNLIKKNKKLIDSFISKEDWKEKLNNALKECEILIPYHEWCVVLYKTLKDYVLSISKK